ncbi:TorF family putative porin [Sphingomonas yunnanensis]|uniref:TorF family putative porin n=1 Tax=Sphingomonas yunnanensis TaxID=310400 RepID=UPI001CA76C1A|nr:TorF family putative porin [Sphingomonas yunnanensis]MBY9063089.1 TorF family putative porin [Sphingomonas yunnanensis]
MKYRLRLAAALLAAGLAVPAAAQDTSPPKPITVSGSVGLVSDYRFRGVSQSDENLAVQGGFTIAHESGIYIGTWGSNLAGWGTFGGANMELDLIAGYKFPVGGGTLDVGATWYMYPGGFDNTDFIEPYAKLSGTLGPASLTAGVAYAPKQEALGNWYLNGTSAANGVYDRPGDKNDNLYVWGDVAAAIPNTGLTAKGHIGASKGNKGLGPFATSVAPTGEYVDWMLGADYAIPTTPLTLGVAYIDTNISEREAAYLQPSFSKGQDGTGTIAGSTVVVSLTAAF